MAKENDQRPDEELMRSYQEGNYSDFEVLYRRHSKKIYGFLFSQLKNRAKADDMFQATFLKLHQSRQHYDPSFPFLPWLFTVTKSVLLDGIKKDRRTMEDSDEAAISNYSSQNSERPSIDLTVLEGQQKRAIEMRYEDDLPFEEIASRLGTTPSNVRQLISRGVRKLKTLAGGSK